MPIFVVILSISEVNKKEERGKTSVILENVWEARGTEKIRLQFSTKLTLSAFLSSVLFLNIRLLLENRIFLPRSHTHTNRKEEASIKFNIYSAEQQEWRQKPL